MATRATYQINTTCFYCHWDGYPTGAAQRFANMVAALTVCNADKNDWRIVEDRRGGFEYAFIRGNLDAEPTEGHEAHGDTEYRYTLIVAGEFDNFPAKITVEERGEGDFRSGFAWRTIYCGDLADWLNARRVELENQMRDYYTRRPEVGRGRDAAAEALEAIPVIVRCVEANEWQKRAMVTYATAATASAIAARLAQYAATFKEDNPNKAEYAKKAAAWQAAA